MASSRFGCSDGFTLAGRMTDPHGDTRPKSAGPVRVAHGGEVADAHYRDFSDTGMTLDLTAPLALHDEVSIALSPSVVLFGSVAWVHGRKCGIVFDGPVDSGSLLDAVAETAIDAGPRATLDLLQGRDVAPRRSSLKTRRPHDGTTFRPGLSVTMLVAPNRERRRVVHWAADPATAHQFAPAGSYHSELTGPPDID